MLCPGLVQTIEDHREAIAQSAVEEIRGDPAFRRMSTLPESYLCSLAERAVESFQMWIDQTDRKILASKFQESGRARFKEEIPLPELVRAVTVWRQRTISYLRNRGFANSALDIYIEEELEYDLTEFYEFALYHLVLGYDEACKARRESFVGDGSTGSSEQASGKGQPRRFLNRLCAMARRGRR
jgi:hypothetical protein